MSRQSAPEQGRSIAALSFDLGSNEVAQDRAKPSKASALRSRARAMGSQRTDGHEDKS